MKKLLYLLLSSYLLISFSCRDISVSNSKTDIEDHDTIIEIKKSPSILSDEVTEVEYSMKVDSLYYSPICVVSETKLRKSILISLENQKVDYENINDSSTVSLINNDSRTYVRMPKTSEEIKILNMLLLRAAKDFNLNRTTAVQFMLSTFEESSFEFATNYTQLYGDHNIDTSKFEEVLKKQWFYKEILQILQHYGIKIKNTYIEKIIEVHKPPKPDSNSGESSINKYWDTNILLTVD